MTKDELIVKMRGEIEQCLHDLQHCLSVTKDPYILRRNEELKKAIVEFQAITKEADEKADRDRFTQRFRECFEQVLEDVKTNASILDNLHQRSADPQGDVQPVRDVLESATGRGAGDDSGTRQNVSAAAENPQ